MRRLCAEMFLIMASPNGSHRDALRVAEQGVALSEHITDPLLRTNALNIFAHLLRTTSAYDQALAAADALSAEAERSGLDFAVDYALLCKAASFVGIRSVGLAKDAIRSLESSDASRHVRANLAIVGARLKIATGDLDGATVILAREPELPTLGVSGEFHAFSAMVHAACGRTDDAAFHLDLASAPPRLRYAEVAANAAAARAVMHAGDRDRVSEAAAYVHDAFARGHCDVLVAACRASPQLAADAIAGGASQTLEALFSASNDIDLGRRLGLAMHREYRRKSGLSPREIQVCELMTAGRSNADIATTLFISESTVKVHIRHIFEKLGVHTRAEVAAMSGLTSSDRD
jgi:DNA-binding NarL/FixJ family response regulator